MKRNKPQVIHSESLAELNRLKEEYEFIGRAATIDRNRMVLTVHNFEIPKKKKRLTRYEKIDNRYSKNSSK